MSAQRDDHRGVEPTEILPATRGDSTVSNPKDVAPAQRAANSSVTTAQVVGLVRNTPALTRVAVSSWWRGTSWLVRTSVHAASEMAKELADGEPAATVFRNKTAEMRSFAWRALGMQEQTDVKGVPERIAARGSSPKDLRSQGEELLRRSADVTYSADTHPAYARIIADLVPDEARVLRFLAVHGAQPAIDVRTNRPLGIGSELVAGGLNMIAEYAGCTHIDRIHPYLTNLNRLGLVEFSKEEVEPHRYQLIEAQPKTMAVMKKAGRAPKTVHRSIRLSSFGKDFCDTCVPTDRIGFTKPQPKTDDTAESD